MGVTGLTRRAFAALALAGAVAMPTYLRAQGKPRLVIVGGGAGGATAARRAAIASRGAVDITLIDDRDSVATCFFSNHYLAGLRNWASITYGYAKLTALGVVKITDRAVAIDRSARQVSLAGGGAVGYDHLILSPGIDMVHESTPGHSAGAAEIAPHAWQGGEEVRLLKQRLDALEDGQSIVMTVPAPPYRCPPGPYERASAMALALNAKGFRRSKIIILDAKDSFSKQALFEEGWASHYPGMIEWYPLSVHGGIVSVDAAAGRVETALGNFDGALLNVIPAQRGGGIAAAAGLAEPGGYCAIEPESMRSILDPSIAVIGDSAIAGDMPKSAFSAGSQARVATDALLAELLGRPAPEPSYANTCWSLISPKNSVKIGGRYAPVNGMIGATDTFISKTGEPAATRQTNFDDSVRWYAQATADMFGS